jgi:DNA polymerase III subunit epsilon
MRQVVLDTETTGLETSQGHRIIEIGGVELENRRLTGSTYHQYVKPEREIDAGAQEVHGITLDFLADKPVFAEVADEFLQFIDGAELVIHNASFDVGFIDHEFGMLNGELGKVADHCRILDSLALARNKHPGQKNSLDALCKRYEIDNSGRDLHGALLDAELLAHVYLAMTGGQVNLGLSNNSGNDDNGFEGLVSHHPIERQGLNFVLTEVTKEELSAHQAYINKLKEEAGEVVWEFDQ